MDTGQGFPVHPLTGFEAIGYKKNGDPIWPVAGGDSSNDPPTPGSPEAGAPLVAGGNPAWNDFLKYVPEDQRSDVVPVLQQWDKGVQDKFQQVHSEYEDWKDFTKSGVDPETAQFAVEVLSKLQEDPRAIYDSLGQHFGWEGDEPPEEDPSEQGLNGDGQQPEFDLENNPAFQQLAQQNRVMADILLAQRNQSLESQEQTNLDNEFKEAEKEFGKFDDNAEEYILMHMAQNDVSVKEAAVAYQNFVEKVSGRKPAPRLHSGSGGGAVPAPKINSAKMSDKEARQAFVQMLTASKEG